MVWQYIGIHWWATVEYFTHNSLYTAFIDCTYSYMTYNAKSQHVQGTRPTVFLYKSLHILCCRLKICSQPRLLA